MSVLLLLGGSRIITPRRLLFLTGLRRNVFFTLTLCDGMKNHDDDTRAGIYNGYVKSSLSLSSRNLLLSSSSDDDLYEVEGGVSGSPAVSATVVSASEAS